MAPALSTCEQQANLTASSCYRLSLIFSPFKEWASPTAGQCKDGQYRAPQTRFHVLGSFLFLGQRSVETSNPRCSRPCAHKVLPQRLMRTHYNCALNPRQSEENGCFMVTFSSLT
ncbi:hypothetical protein AG1IA_04653 [Rhizoctonia solani AG-1 IA]|uniref:Uncharacterized protein n=1 Tax=Thanatephorus cucumeris (strain AG1-IA) TaxID=983506 RepID=L8WX31_THACA|nr:hypothetical protein AG1IA_04653 [Rhizoctonia solani AG-1 IA]